MLQKAISASLAFFLRDIKKPYMPACFNALKEI